MSQVILEIPGVVGECGVKDYEGMILCETLSHEIETEIETTANTRRTVHVPTIANFQFGRKWDKASTQLIKRILAAQVDGGDWKVHCLKSLGGDGMQVEFLLITLKKPVLATYSLEISDGETTENFSINAVEVTWDYSEFNDLSAKVGSQTCTFNTISGSIS